MEHKQFIEELQKRLGMSRKDVDGLLSDTLQIIKERSVVMDSFAIQGFGTFEPRKRAERVSVNPGTLIKNKLKESTDNEQ